VSDLDAKPRVANLDARFFAQGYTNPLAMMELTVTAFFRAISAMLVTKPM